MFGEYVQLIRVKNTDGKDFGSNPPFFTINLCRLIQKETLTLSIRKQYK